MYQYGLVVYGMKEKLVEDCGMDYGMDVERFRDLVGGEIDRCLVDVARAVFQSTNAIGTFETSYQNQFTKTNIRNQSNSLRAIGENKRTKDKSNQTCALITYNNISIEIQHTHKRTFLEAM